jgi:hypothetical protein
MRNLILGLAAASLSFAAAAPVANANPAPQLFSGIYRTGDPAAFEPVQYLYAGHNYCWYPNGWRGPGFYWCGYALRNGLGWGGGVGWHGWNSSGRGGGRGGSHGGGRPGGSHGGGHGAGRPSGGHGGGHGGGSHGGGHGGGRGGGGGGHKH